MGGLGATGGRQAAIDKLKSVFVSQHSPLSKQSVATSCPCAFLAPDLLSLLVVQPASFPLPGPDTGKGEWKERAEEGRRGNKGLNGLAFPDFICGLGKRTLEGAKYLNTAT